MTAGVIVGERVFGSARSTAVGPAILGIVGAAVETFIAEVGLAKDMRLARLSAASIRAVVGFAPPGPRRIQARPGLHAVRIRTTAG